MYLIVSLLVVSDLVPCGHEYLCGIELDGAETGLHLVSGAIEQESIARMSLRTSLNAISMVFNFFYQKRTMTQSFDIMA